MYSLTFAPPWRRVMLRQEYQQARPPGEAEEVVGMAAAKDVVGQ